MKCRTLGSVLLVVDPDNPSRFVQIRGEVDLITDGAAEHVRGLTRKFKRHPCVSGRFYPAEQEARETGVIG